MIQKLIPPSHLPLSLTPPSLSPPCRFFSGQAPQDTDNDPRAKDFFEEVGDDLRVRASGSGPLVFNQLNLSRPLLRAVEGMGYVTPTPIQVRLLRCHAERSKLLLL